MITPQFLAPSGSVLLQEMDLLLYGDSILESFLGNQIGQPRAEWADIADVWTKHHGGSKSKILAISGLPCPTLVYTTS